METFEAYIKDYLRDKYKKKADELYSLSYILQYLVYKTKSANKGAKARGSFANLYAIYVIVEDYLQKCSNTRKMFILTHNKHWNTV